MKKKSHRNTSQNGWHCSHCKAFNKVNSARFCGQCGSAHILTDKSHDSCDGIFKGVLVGAAMFILLAIVAGYKMYNSVDTIRLGRSQFSDIAVDHPVYEVCRRLLDIDAIGFRKNLELAPYENISTKEWNHVLEKASKYLKCEYNVAAYFSAGDTISVDSLRSKFVALNAENTEITDTSRLQSFYMLEQALFN